MGILHPGGGGGGSWAVSDPENGREFSFTSLLPEPAHGVSHNGWGGKAAGVPRLLNRRASQDAASGESSGNPDSSSSAAQSSHPDDKVVGTISESHPHPTLPPLKLGGDTATSIPLSTNEPPAPQSEFSTPEASAKYASSIAVETHVGTTPERDAQGGEFQKGYEKGLQGIEGLQLDADPKKKVLGRLQSKSV